MRFKRRESVLGVLQQVGHSFFLPISILPIAGICLGIGTVFTNDIVIKTYHLEGILGERKLLFMLLLLMNAIGTAVIVNLPIILAKSVALGMSKSKRMAALLSSGLSFVVMHATISTILRLSGLVMQDGTISAAVHSGAVSHVLGIPTLQMGAVAGIATGIAVAFIHNNVLENESLIPTRFTFLQGTKAVPIICTLVFTFLGVVSMLVWPLLQAFIRELDGLVTGTLYLGTFLYGFIERLLLPFGLHHVFYLPFWETAIGGTAVIDGQTVSGAQNIFYSEILSPDTAHFNVETTRFLAGKYAFMMGGLPGASFAMYKCASEKRKKQVGKLLLLAAGTCFLTGITEPIELTFLFAAPSLYLVHCILAGLSFLFTYLAQATVGTTFSCGLLDFVLFGVMQGNDKSSWFRLVPLIIAYFFIYYFIFKYAIKRFNFITPGREGD